MTKRSRETIGTDALKKFQRDCDIKDTEMFNLLCQTNSVVSRWHKVELMPKWVLLALEGLRRRSKANEKRVGIILVNKNQMEKLDRLFEIVDVEIHWIENLGG